MNHKAQDFVNVLEELEQVLSIETKKETKTSVISDWNINYLRKSKNRYLNDLKIIADNFQGGTILEIGSAPFHLTYCLHKLGESITGCDVAPERFDQFIAENALNVAQCNIEETPLPFADNEFDFIIFNEVFEHLRINPIKTLIEIQRVLKPNGLFMLSTPNLYSIENVGKFLLGRGFDDPYDEFNKIEKLGHMGHVRDYSKPQVAKFLENTGYKVKQHHFCSFSKKAGIKKIMVLLRTVFPFFNSHQVFISTKTK